MIAEGDPDGIPDQKRGVLQAQSISTPARWQQAKKKLAMAAEMNQRIVKVASTRDPRVTNRVSLGVGEGFATFTADFEGSPAFLVDCGTMNDFLDDDDQDSAPVSIHVFGTTEDRDRYLDEMRRTNPGAIGVSADWDPR